ncbi:MAG: YggS family pyridoxal phosphate-dependent enzyme [Chlorobi bacterium]|nr:YggS family pyridoxal phosphate-dependent enzyme [Chlorobiota bacterium]
MITEKFKIVNDNIERACKLAGRNPSDVKLIAVSKTKPAEMIFEAYEAGLIHFGENKAQELRDKAAKIDRNIVWHFIGHLQTNKVKYVVKDAEYIHAADSKKIIDEINKRAAKEEKSQKVLLEVNVSGEETKYGLRTEDEIFELTEYCLKQTNIDLQGLMTMAPFTDDEKIIRAAFSGLKQYFDKLNSNGFNLKELSMGMSHDYEIAIEEGATMIRLGTVLFGARNR